MGKYINNLGYEFLVENQEWNKNKGYLELYASFVNPALINKYKVGTELIKKKEVIPQKSIWRKIFKLDIPSINQDSTIEENKEKVDPTEGRWGKITPLLDKYKIEGTSGGMDRQRIAIPAPSNSEATKVLENMLNEMKEICGSEFPINFNITDSSFGIYHN